MQFTIQNGELPTAIAAVTTSSIWTEVVTHLNEHQGAASCHVWD